MSYGKFFGRHSSPPRPKIEWAEYPGDGDELADEFWMGLAADPAKFTPEEIRRGSACGEGGCE